MHVDKQWLQHAIETELQSVSDDRVVARIRSQIVDPYAVTRIFEFGDPKSDHLCWIALADPEKNKGVAYASTGFGPRRPWGVIHLACGQPHETSMGADDSWHLSFLEAWLDEFAPTNLPIWRVARSTDDAVVFLSDRGAWQTQWEAVKRLRETEDPSLYYSVETDIFPRRLRSGRMILY